MDEAKLELGLSEGKKSKLQDIVNELHVQKSIPNNNLNEFLEFTLFIVFDEYEKSKESLSRFYKANLENYLKHKAD
ncbi:MAG: hypothetical protein M3162_00420 [Thermoproteota archaeon]|nr:hypothetical protein [Thermoproteota archaeon]